MSKVQILLISFILLFQDVVSAQPIPPSANELLKNACLIASKENKNVFVIFHASWCSWCHKMDKSMKDECCNKFFDENYVICHLDVDESKEKKHLENPGAAEMKIKYNGDGQGIPYWLVFDADGNLLSDSKSREKGEGPAGGVNTGCPVSEKEVAYFISVLKKTSRLNNSQLEVIRKRFRENDN